MPTRSVHSTISRARGFAPQAAVQHQHFHELFFDGVQRVKRDHRFLKDHRDLIAAHLAQRRFRRMQQRVAVEQDIAGRVKPPVARAVGAVSTGR